MNSFYLTVDASSVYGTTAPTLEILVDGVVVASAQITASGGYSFLLEFPFGDNFPSLLSMQFNDGSGEGGRSISLNSVSINGQVIDNSHISQMVLLQTQSASVDTAAIDHLFGQVQPTAFDIGTPTITGTAGDDRIDPDGGTDHVIDGMDGNNWIWVRDGDNKISTGTGDDTVNGGTGNDMIAGGDGNNRLYGNGGDDYITAGSGTDFMSGGAGNDVLAGFGGADTILGAAGNDILYGGAGADTLVGGIGDDQMYGNDDADILSAGAGADTLYGGAGADSLYGNAGNDTIYGESEDDFIMGDAGTDTLYGDAGNDFLFGGLDNDTIHGGTGADRLYGDEGNDTLNGNDDADLIVGGNGSDTIDGGNGADIIYANGLSASQISAIINANTGVVFNEQTNSFYKYVAINTTWGVAHAAATANTLSGVAGHLIAINSATENSYALTLTGGALTWIGGSDAAVESQWSWMGGLEAGTPYWQAGVGVNNQYANWAAGEPNGGAGIDAAMMDAAGTWQDRSSAEVHGYIIEWEAARFSDDGVANTLNGGANDDIIYGGSGADVINGGSGADQLIGGAGADIMTGGTGDDFYSVDNAGDAVSENTGEGADTVLSTITYTLTADVENLSLGGTNNINGTGNALSNIITGNTGNNVLDGAGGADGMAGGTGNDTYVVDDAGDVITENAAEGTDLVQSSITHTLSANLENLTLTGGSNINGTGNTLDNTITGNTGNNTLSGGAGADILDGGAGTDTLIGGTGNDTFIVDTATDTITENAAEGTDLVQSSVTFSLATMGNVENLTLTGSGNINGTGNGGNNTITGNTGHNVLDGGAGTDTLVGGAGNDTYIVDSTTDTITENAGQGTDLVQSSVTFSLSAMGEVENLTLTGAGNINGTGNTGNNTITGNTGNNVLDGGAGTDTLAGGTGNDTYVVDSLTDTITENAAEGTDLIESSITFTIASLGNIENLTLTGTGNINGTGNTGNNVITGNTGNNVIDGGAGDDTMVGGAGNDTYTVDSTSDVITENAAEGTDLVYSGATYTLSANLEDLTLTGSGNINGTGNASANVILGNTGNNVLDGAGGADSMSGGAGNDTYIVDNAGDSTSENAAEGTDLVQSSVTHTIGSNIENLTLTGAGNINGTGNTLDNTITGNTGNNVLNGGTGIDTLVGGTGNDTYIVDALTDVITENAAEGTDTVQTNITYTLASLGNLENLTLTGSGNVNGTGNGNNNTITGNTGNNVLDGGAGTDTLVGGAGNDTYVVDNTLDTITENAAEGMDLVQASATFTLGAEIENLTLTGGSNINGTGNTLDNTITGNTGNNTLSGGAGADILDGGAGTDTLIGGTGNDTFIVDTATDTITENAAEGTDLVQSSVTFTLAAMANVENLTLTGSGNINGTGNGSSNTITGNTGNNVLDGGAGADTMVGGTGNDTYVVDNAGDAVTENAAEGTDLVQSSVTYTLSADVENLTLTGGGNINGTGNTLSNTITGNTGANILDGGAGIDSLIGGTGNDTYIVDDTSDTITENVGEGTDLVQSSATYTLGNNLENLTLTGSGNINGTGNTLNNTITGNTGNNTLDGGAGTDTLVGGAGNDTYVVDSTTDTITENAAEGTDLVQSSVTFTLAAMANVENLTLTGVGNINGTGNGSNNTITGNTGNNVIDGGTGNDTLIGGAGNDTYIVDSTTDTITENAAEGTDLVQSSVTYTLSADIENLTLTGAGNINGTGNASNNTITGNTGNNVLNGSGGTDTLIGGTGNDTYIVDSTGDTITENAGEGTDLVQSSVTFTIAALANIENLTLTSSANINGTGNAGNNTITGNSGNNTLDGGGGTDTLIGGLGNDTYVVDTTTDTITENAAEGTDLVQSSATYTLGNNLENLTLTGAGNINGTGNTLDNTITGNSGTNTLSGGAGNDVLDGGTGADSMSGGTGNDTFVIDNAGDTVTENVSEGTDLIQSSITYTLGSNIENLTLTGSSNINGTGNASVNTITGNSGNNTLDGGGGADTIYGGAGNDTIVGGSGDVLLSGDGDNDIITSGSTSSSGWVQAILDANPGVMYFSTTGNFYQYITTTVSATTAFANAAAAMLEGVAGHLITITSVDENSFMDAQLSAQGWIAAYDQGNTNNWIWNAGPETGQAIVYENWKAGEPNNTAPGGGGAVIYARMDTNGEWLDTNDSGTLYGYVIEWEGTDLAPASNGTTVDGGDGNDTITGGAGGDTLNGGNGTDTITATGSDLVSLMAADFSVDNDSFAYADGGFGGSDPANADVTGTRITTDGNNGNGSLEVYVDGLNASSSTNISGNWSRTINLANAATGVELDISYRHVHDANNDNGENSYVYIQVDGVYYGVGGNNWVSEALGSGGATDTGWVSITLNIANLSVGNHTITMGIFHTAENNGNEDSYVRFDDLSLTGYTTHGNTTILNGGDGLDTLVGSASEDHFVFEAASAFNNVDIVQNFSTATADALDISDILAGTSYVAGVSSITNFLQITDSGADSVVRVDVTGTGTFGAGTQIATLQGVTGLTNEALLLSNGNIIDT